jgi:hypothetical protein
MIDFIVTDSGIQWVLVGVSGSMGLYMSESYCGSCYSSKDWAVDFGNGEFVTFADRPSIKFLIERDYPYSNDCLKIWKKVKV